MLESDPQGRWRTFKEDVVGSASARLRLGFHTNIEISGPADSQANGRVEREIQTARGMARTLVHGVKEACAFKKSK